MSSSSCCCSTPSSTASSSMMKMILLFYLFVGITTGTIDSPSIATTTTGSPSSSSSAISARRQPHGSSPWMTMAPPGDGVGSSSRATYCPKKTEVCTVMFINLDFTINYTLIAVPTTFDTKEGVGPVLLSFKPYVGAIDSAEAYPAPEVQYMWIFWFKDMSYGTYTLYISKESAKTMTPVGILINGGYSPEGLLPSIGGNDNTACNKQLQTMTALLIATSVAIAVIGLPLFIVLRIRRQRRKHSVDRIDAEEATAAGISLLASRGSVTPRHRYGRRSDDSDDMYSEGSDLVTLYALDPLQDLDDGGGNMLHFAHSQLAVYDAPPPSVAGSDSTLASSQAASPRFLINDN